MTVNGSSPGSPGVTDRAIFTDADWLDTHFEAARTEYEALLRAAGIAPGSRVLDAGCGSGAFLPLLAELAGPSGAVIALDGTHENAVCADRVVREQRLPCAAWSTTGTLPALPYADATFDAVWCANTTQYLGAAELMEALREFRRVLRPGGIVAVKDVDMLLMRIYPGDPCLFTRLADAAARTDPTPQSEGSLRGRELRRWLERAGFGDTWQRIELIERWAPLRPSERRLYVEWLSVLARRAEECGVFEDDRARWAALRDPEASGHLVDRPDFYACEGQVLAVGRRV